MSPNVSCEPLTGKILITLNERKAGTHNLGYTVEASNDLADWETLVVNSVSRSDHASLVDFETAGYETASGVIIEPRQFVRVKFSLTP